MGSYHGFLWQGMLIDIDRVEHDRSEWDSLPQKFKTKLKQVTERGTIPWDD